MGIYTKAGDNGFASTLNRRMIAKNNPIFSLLGTLDELCAALGVARSGMPDESAGLVEAVQQDVTAFSGELAGGAKFASAERVAGMESSIDMLMAAGGSEEFTASGASEAGAALDLARAIARRAERELVGAKQTGGVSREAMMWMNRLSDLLYALARLMDAQSGGKKKSAGLPPAGDFLETALWLCRRVLDEAKGQGIAVVTAACDAGGNDTALLRADNAYIASVDIARNKAFTSASLQMTTEKLGTLCHPGGLLYGIQHTNGGRMVIFGGGIPLFQDGRLIGGFGVSGGSAEQDTAFAHFAQELFDTAFKGGM